MTVLAWLSNRKIRSFIAHALLFAATCGLLAGMAIWQFGGRRFSPALLAFLSACFMLTLFSLGLHLTNVFGSVRTTIRVIRRVRRRRGGRDRAG